MYDFSEVEKLLPPSIKKAIQPIVTGDTTDDSIYQEFTNNVISVMSSEYGSNVLGVKDSPWVKTVFVNMLSKYVSATLSGLSKEFLEKIEIDFKYSVKLLQKNSNTTTNVKSGCYPMSGMYGN
jgi:predicted KAP-like P-loop ATPase